MGNFLGYDLTLLGIDILHRGVVYRDLDEERLLNLIEAHAGKLILLLSPMGGQGFLIGRGNLQLSPEVLWKIGIDNILGIATPAKLLGLNRLRIDSGDSELDDRFKERRFIKMLQGYRTTRVVRVAED
jgi:predicted polyphosphate/ATP-dependent NAD kinase